MTRTDYRVEHDSMGALKVTVNALWRQRQFMRDLRLSADESDSAQSSTRPSAKHAV